jgi:membrane-associated protease RseP (regulator of RpoE activity)
MVQEYSMMVGMGLIICLMLFVTYNDLRMFKILDFVGL